MIPTMAIVTRRTARSIILTPDDEILMIRRCLSCGDSDLWILLGRGLERGEDALSALARGTHEETSATNLQILGEAWRQDVRIWG